MKILVINKFLFPKGGDAIYTLNLGNLLISKGHEVVFWGMDHPSNPAYRFSKNFVSYVDYNKSQGIGGQLKAALNMLYSFEAKKKIEQLIKIERPDIVHLNNFAHQISPSILHVFKKFKIPVVMTMHDYKLVCPSYSLLLNGRTCEKCSGGRYFECVLNRCTKGSYLKSLLSVLEMYLHHKIMKIYDLVRVYISPSRFLKDKLSSMGFKGQVEWVPNFLDPVVYRPEYKWEGRCIVCFGRLSHEKGLFTLIEAIRGFPDISLKIIGEGPIKTELEVYVNNKEISNVAFMGFVAGETLRDMIRKSMFVVIASECYDNNPLSVLEGLALGKPVVGSRIGGIPEMIKDGETGLTFEPGNVADLKEKIRYMLEHSGDMEKMGRTARLFVEKERNSESYYNALMAIYTRCINEK